MRKPIAVTCVLLSFCFVITGCNTLRTDEYEHKVVEITTHIASVPANAEILAAEDEKGPWNDLSEASESHKYRINGSRYTDSTIRWRWPAEVSLWVKVRKAGYQDSEPEHIYAPGWSGAKIQDRSVSFTLAEGKTPPGPIDIGHDGPPPPDVVSTTLYIDSEPRGAEVLMSESMNGEYHLWRAAEGEARTPTKGKVVVGDTFWIRVRWERQESLPEYVHITSDLEQRMMFTRGGKGGVDKAGIAITSEPSDAEILASDDEFGQYQPWPFDQGGSATPYESEINVGTDVWLKLRKDDCGASKPIHIKVKPGEAVNLHVVLPKLQSTAPPRIGYGDFLPSFIDAAQTEGAQAGGGIEVTGFAPVGKEKEAARQQAILDALGAAIRQKYGAVIESERITNNYELMQDRIVSTVKGRYESYDILEEGERNGLCFAKLRVHFREDILEDIKNLKLTFLVGGREAVCDEVAGDATLSARRLIGDDLMDAAMGVTLKETECDSAKDMARDAADRKQSKFQADLALWINARTEVFNTLGKFSVCETSIEYQLVMPVPPSELLPEDTSYIIASNEVQVKGERKLSVQDAAKSSVRKASEAVVEDVLKKVARRATESSLHELMVVGALQQQQRDMLERDLREIEGVTEVRPLPFSRAYSSNPDEDIHRWLIYMKAADRPKVSNRISRVTYITLEVAETDLYHTVAFVNEKRADK